MLLEHSLTPNTDEWLYQWHTKEMLFLFTAPDKHHGGDIGRMFCQQVELGDAVVTSQTRSDHLTVKMPTNSLWLLLLLFSRLLYEAVCWAQCLLQEPLINYVSAAHAQMYMPNPRTCDPPTAFLDGEISQTHIYSPSSFLKRAQRGACAHVWSADPVVTVWFSKHSSLPDRTFRRQRHVEDKEPPNDLFKTMIFLWEVFHYSDLWLKFKTLTFFGFPVLVACEDVLFFGCPALETDKKAIACENVLSCRCWPRCRSH